jgi:hypothetical protein
MKGSNARHTAIGPSASTMNGRRRPSGRCVASLIGPTKSGMKNAKMPSAARTSPIRVAEWVNSPRTGGR